MLFENGERDRAEDSGALPVAAHDAVIHGIEHGRGDGDEAEIARRHEQHGFEKQREEEVVHPEGQYNSAEAGKPLAAAEIHKRGVHMPEDAARARELACGPELG